MTDLNEPQFSLEQEVSPPSVVAVGRNEIENENENENIMFPQLSIEHSIEDNETQPMLLTATIINQTEITTETDTITETEVTTVAADGTGTTTITQDSKKKKKPLFKSKSSLSRDPSVSSISQTRLMGISPRGEIEYHHTAMEPLETDQPKLSKEDEYDSDDYDLSHSHFLDPNANPKQMSNFSHAFWNLCKGFVGAASFSLPWAVAQCGLGLATIGFIVLAYLTHRTNHWLILAGHHTPHPQHRPTYPQVAYAAFGQVGTAMVWFGIYANMVGACGTYLLFIAGVLSEAVIDKVPWMTQQICVLLILPFPLTLACLRSYRLIAKTAKWGVVGVLVALLVTVGDGIYLWATGGLTVQLKNIRGFDFLGFPIFVGNASFLFVLHPVILSLEEQMIDRERFNISPQMARALMWSISVVLIANTLFADFIYICWSENSAEDFPQNIVTALDKGLIQIFTKVFLCIDLLFTYAIVMYPFTEALEMRLFRPDKFGTKEEEMKRNILRTTLVISTALVAMFIPYFGYLTGLTGGVGSVMVGFILPPLCIWKLAPQKLNKVDQYLIWIVLIFGVSMFFLSPILIIQDMLKNEN